MIWAVVSEAAVATGMLMDGVNSSGDGGGDGIDFVGGGKLDAGHQVDSSDGDSGENTSGSGSGLRNAADVRNV